MKNKLLSLLFIVNSLGFILSSNNFYLKNPCEQNSDKTLISCELNLNQSKEKISSKILKGGINQQKIIQEIKFEIRKLEGEALHIKLFDMNHKRYEIPRNSIEYFEKERPFLQFGDTKNIEDLFSLKKSDKFTFNLKDKKGENNLMTLFNENLIFIDDFINFDYLFNSNQIFGYGERSSNFKLKPGVYTTWPRDDANFFDDGKGAKNSYGHQSFFMVRNKADSYIGVSFLNSNAADLYIEQKNSDGKTQVNQVTIGGIIEMVITYGKTPLDVLSRYHNIIGRPILPNLWSLGFHQCRWGYKNADELREVVRKYNENKIPLDTIWSDIDYMKDYEDFGYNDQTFKGLPEFVNEIHESKMHYVPIIDMGIPYRKENYYYKLGKELDIFIKSNYTNTDLLNNVWPGVCVYPDFTNYEKTKTFWQKGLSNLHENLKFDGIWLDMNEPSGFNHGENLNIPKNPDLNKYSDLTYSPGLERDGYNIETKSLSVNAILSKENEPHNTIYNLKPLNVFYQNKMTTDYFINNNRRPFVLSRSSFTGMGRYTSHWLGDNFSTYEDMIFSIAGIFNFQMFGFNQVGADICGFNDNTNDELCARWLSLGSFYPFSRNHNSINMISQEPWALGDKTLNSAKKSIRYRYSLLRYIYTQMYLSSLNGGAFFQPLFFQFPQYDEFVENDEILNKQIMLGDSIMFNPILQKGEENVKFAMPNENWNRFPNGEIVMKKNSKENNKSTFMDFPGTFNDIHLFIKGGSIIPYYDIIDDENILTTKDLENHHISFIVNPDSLGNAKGNVIYDISDSDPYKTLEQGKYLHLGVNYDGKNNKIQFNKFIDFDYSGRDVIVDKIIVYNTKIEKAKEISNMMKNYLKKNATNNNIIKTEINGNLIIKFVKPISLKNVGTIEF